MYYKVFILTLRYWIFDFQKGAFVVLLLFAEPASFTSGPIHVKLAASRNVP